MFENAYPRVALTVLAVAALSACSFIPTYERPAAPVAVQFPGQAQAAPAADDGVQHRIADITDAGAVTLANGSTGQPVGAVSSANSLVATVPLSWLQIKSRQALMLLPGNSLR